MVYHRLNMEKKRQRVFFSFLARRCIRPEDRIEYDISLFEGSKERRRPHFSNYRSVKRLLFFLFNGNSLIGRLLSFFSVIQSKHEGGTLCIVYVWASSNFFLLFFFFLFNKKNIASRLDPSIPLLTFDLLS